MSKLRLQELHLLRLLKLIYRHTSVTRSQLAQEMGCSAFLVSKFSERLLRTGLVTEVGIGDSTGGRRPKLLSVSPGLGRLVGIDLGMVKAKVAITDLTGNALEYELAESQVSEGPDMALRHVFELVRRCLKRAHIGLSEVWGIGMGISAVMDRARGSTPFWPKAPQWGNVPVRQILADEFHLPVEVMDSVRTMALAERRWGLLNNAGPCIYVVLGAGIGAALFLDGSLYTGWAGFAGEFGHMTVDPKGPPCSCGNQGCVEVMASATALIGRAREAIASGLSEKLWLLCGGKKEMASVELIVKAAQEADRFSLNLLREAGNYIGTGVVGLVNLMDPELIVLGGGLATTAAQFLSGPIQRAVQERAIERSAKTVKIQISTLREVDWARGAALTVSEKVLESRFSDFLKGPSPVRPGSRRGKAVRAGVEEQQAAYS